MDHDKVVVVSKWRQPNNTTKVRRFLGLARYHRYFINKFNLLVALEIELTKKNIQFLWSNDHERAFQDIKSRLTNIPMLVIPIRGGKLVACIGLGTILMQEGKVVAYTSCQMEHYEVLF